MSTTSEQQNYNANARTSSMKKVALAALVILAGLNEPVMSQNLQQQYEKKRSAEEECEKFRAASQYKDAPETDGRVYVNGDNIVYTGPRTGVKCKVSFYILGKTKCSEGFYKGRSGYVTSLGAWIKPVEPYYYESCRLYVREAGSMVLYWRIKRWDTARQLTMNETTRYALKAN